MENNDDRNGLLFVLAGIGIGALIGAACGLLFAPKTGNEMRADISTKLDDLRKKVSDVAGDVSAKLSSAVEQVKTAAQHKVAAAHEGSETEKS